MTRDALSNDACSRDGTGTCITDSAVSGFLSFCRPALAIFSVKQGGSTNPATNTMLASALAFAKQIGAPKDLIDRNIKKASEKGQADYSEIVYEVRQAWVQTAAAHSSGRTHRSIRSLPS